MSKTTEKAYHNIMTRFKFGNLKQKVFPKIQNNRMRMLLHMPVISKKVKEKICDHS